MFGPYRRERPRDPDEAELLRELGTPERLIGPTRPPRPDFFLRHGGDPGGDGRFADASRVGRAMSAPNWPSRENAT